MTNYFLESLPALQWQLDCAKSAQHSLANRNSCSTPAETQDLILVVDKVDMINQICQMLSFCWKLLSAYLAEKMITKYITKYSSNCKVCMY